MLPFSQVGLHDTRWSLRPQSSTKNISNFLTGIVRPSAILDQNIVL